MLASFTFFMTIDVIKVIYHYHMARMIIVTANILFGIVKISYNCQGSKSNNIYVRMRMPTIQALHYTSSSIEHHKQF